MPILFLFLLIPSAFAAQDNNYYLRYAKLVSGNKISEIMLKNPDDSLGCIRFEETYTTLESSKDPLFKNIASAFYCKDGKAIIHWFSRGINPQLSHSGSSEKVAQFTAPKTPVPEKMLVKKTFPVSLLSDAVITRIVQSGVKQRTSVVLNKEGASRLPSDFETMNPKSVLGTLVSSDKSNPRALGILAENMEKGSILESVDIREGDLLISFDGMPLDQQKFTRTLEALILVNLKNTTPFYLRLIREKKFIEMNYQFE